MTARTTVRLTPELLRAAKLKAAGEGRTLTSLIEEGLRHMLRAPRAEDQRAKPFKIPVSKAKGGLRPGFDLTNMSTIYELEDIEYMKHIRKRSK